MVEKLAAKRTRAPHLGPARRRPAVLDAALAVYAEHGYRGTSMQAVARACGVTKPVVYECFPNKDALLLALLDREQQRLRDSAVAALERAPGDEGGGTVENALEAFFVAACATPASWQVVFNAQAGGDGVVARRVQQIRAELVDRLGHSAAAYLRRADVADAARKVPVLAEIIASVIEGCVRMLVYGTTDWTARELAGYAARMLTVGARGA